MSTKRARITIYGREPAAEPSRSRVVGYCRVSTEKQADHGVSLDVQRSKIEAYAALYDLDVVALEVDAGLSASTLERPALARALAALEAGRADGVIVVKLDRLTRSVRDLGALVDRYFAGGRFALVSVSENVDTRTAAGRLVLNVLGAVSQWEREAIGERTSAAMQHKRARGEYTGGPPPYGWRCGPAGHLERDPAERVVVEVAAELRALGMSLREIGAELEARGLLPRSGRRWHATTVRSLCAASVAA